MKQIRSGVGLLKIFCSLLLFALLGSGCMGGMPGMVTTQEPHGGMGFEATSAPPNHNMASVFPEVEDIYDRVDADGTLIEFTIRSEDNFFGPTEVKGNGIAVVKFKITNASTGEPLADIAPKAWIDTDPAAGTPVPDPQSVCKERVQTHLQGLLYERAVIDLNSFFILTMNHDSSVSVIDPLVNLAGRTQLYATLQLNQPGEDWTLTRNQQRLFISVPKAGEVVVAETQGFQIQKNIATGGVPVRLEFQPDEKYLWVGNDSDKQSESGVMAIDPASQEIVARIATGTGHHEFAFSADSRYVFVTSENSSTLAVIDTQALKVVKELKTGAKPAGVGVSALSQAVYTISSEDGLVHVFSGTDFSQLAVFEAEPGLYSLSFSPEGHWGLITNPSRDEVYVLDIQNNKLTHTLEIKGRPDQVFFSTTTVYIRNYASNQVGVVLLADLSGSAAPGISLVSYGTRAPNEGPLDSIAGAMASLAGEKAVLIANPGEGMVYYLPEGSAAPQGNFQGYGKSPRAVMVVDRSLQEEAPGIYSGRFRVPHDGSFSVALLLDNLNITHCFAFTAKVGEVEGKLAVPPKVEILTSPLEFKVGEDFTLQLKVNDSETGSPIENLEDVEILIQQSGGNWNNRYKLSSLGAGVYAVRIQLPAEGLYPMFVSIASMKVTREQLPSTILKAGK